MNAASIYKGLNNVNVVIDEMDIDDNGHVCGPEMGCINCKEVHGTKLVNFDARRYLVCLECKECLEPVVIFYQD